MKLSLFVLCLTLSLFACAPTTPTTPTSNPSSARVREVLDRPGVNGHPARVQQTEYGTGPYMTPQ